jgi:hypothetical protein
MGWRGFGFVHRSRTVFCRAVPNPNLTIRNCCIAVQRAERTGRGNSLVERAAQVERQQEQQFAHRANKLLQQLDAQESKRVAMGLRAAQQTREHSVRGPLFSLWRLQRGAWGII